jgi:hypothetical protein
MEIVRIQGPFSREWVLILPAILAITSIFTVDKPKNAASRTRRKPHVGNRRFEPASGSGAEGRLCCLAS